MNHASSTLIFVALLSAPPAVAQSLEYVCPIDKIKEAYVEITGPQKTLSALTVEKHVLQICRQSQEIILKIAANDKKLQEIYGGTEDSASAVVTVDTSGTGYDKESVKETPPPPLPEVILVAILSSPSAEGDSVYGALVNIDNEIIDVQIGDTIAAEGVITTITSDAVHISFTDGRQLIVEWGPLPSVEETTK